MFSMALSLLFFCGIKCENHTAVSLLLNRFFSLIQLSDLLTNAKIERINRQYYISDDSADENVSRSLISQAEEFNLNMGDFILNLSLDKVAGVRNKISDI